MNSYLLAYEHQTDDALLFLDGDKKIWVPKCKVTIDGVEPEEYDSLTQGEEVDVNIPDWLAMDKDLM